VLLQHPVPHAELPDGQQPPLPPTVVPLQHLPVLGSTDPDEHVGEYVDV
jgi:hypothetical protein